MTAAILSRHSPTATLRQHLIKKKDEFTVIDATQVDPSALKDFLTRVYPPERSRFLHRHGIWWHRGNENRWVTVTNDNEIAAYCAVIPIDCLVDGSPRPAIWWVDLIVLPEYRGLGLQRELDRRVREAASLKLGFPNDLAAKIHLKHSWGVDDRIRVMMLPLKPLQVRQIQAAHGLRAILLRGGAGIASPSSGLMRTRFGSYQAESARAVDNPSAGALADVFLRHNAKSNVITTFRDAEFIQWRYLDCPYRDELTFYASGPEQMPTHVLISRTMQVEEWKVTRILDVFGDFDDHSGLLDILRLARRDAVQTGAVQMLSLASHPAWIRALRRAGFLIAVNGFFCWLSASDDDMQAIDEKTHHWSYSDSDNDGLIS